LALDDDIRIMGEVPVLAEVPREGLRLLAFSAESRILRTGDILFREGQPADCGYVVASGAIIVGREGGPQRVATKGSLIDELALLCETARSATATAREPSQVLRVPRTLFTRVLDEFPGVAARLYVLLAERVLAETGRLEAIGRELEIPLPPRKRKGD
jgi:CRP-like cAMP-binding protein